MKNLFVKYIALLGLSVILLVSGCQLTAAGMTITSPRTRPRLLLMHAVRQCQPAAEPALAADADDAADHVHDHHTATTTTTYFQR